MRASGFASGHLLQRQQPGGVTTDARRRLAEHHLSNFPSLPRQPQVAEVNGDPSERHDPGRVQDTDDVRRRVHRELTLEGGGGVGETPHLQELPATPGLEDADGPTLPVTLRRSDAFRRQLK